MKISDQRFGWRWLGRRQSGYSIVEIAIVLVAFSFVVTGSVWAFSSQHKLSQRNTVEKEMEAIETAILAYATRTRTQGISVQFVEVGSSLTTQPRSEPIWIPAGRPILPCPDLNGDGFEDRTRDSTGASADTVTITYRTTDEGMIVVSLDDVAGRCVDIKGDLPWRTLGVPPTDPWDHNYTYRVDAAMSHSLFGFDQTTRANQVFKFLAVPIVGGDYTYAVHWRPGNIAGNLNTLGYYSTGRNVVPTSAAVFRVSYDDQFRLRTFTDDFGVWFSFYLAAGTPMTFGLPVPNESRLAKNSFWNQAEWRKMRHSDGPEALIYEFRGLQFSRANTVVSGRPGVIDPYAPALVDGIAFGLVSHGPNGNGARVHDKNSPPSATAQCQPFPGPFSAATIGLFDFERSNAARSAPCSHNELELTSCSPVLLRQSVPDIYGFVNCGIRPAFTPGVFAQTGSFSALFVGPDIPRDFRTSGNAAARSFDDITTWMMPNELVEEMRDRKILPVELPPIAVANVYSSPPYDYTDESNIFL